MAPDEFIVVTALRAHRCVRSVTRCELAHGMSYGPGTLLNSYPTLVLFPAETSPHPVLWTDPSTLVKCQVGGDLLQEEASGQQGAAGGYGWGVG